MNMRALSQEERQKWLDQVIEEVIEPEQRICDPHHHLWNHPGHVYEKAQVLADTQDGHNIISTVFVECMSNYRTEGEPQLFPVGETEYVQNIAQDIAQDKTQDKTNPQNPDICAGIVSFADLTQGASIRQLLQAHIAEAPERFRGIRHASAWDAAEVMRPSHTNPPPFLLADARFREGFAELAPLNLSFDAWLYHTQISELYHLAKAFPNTQIILDHLGGPLGIGVWAGKREAMFAGWKLDINLLAQCPNVSVKLGGVAMPVNGLGWHREDQPMTSDQYVQTYGQWIEHAIEAFGVTRCMFESNFPVDRVSLSYRTLFNAFKKIVASYSADEKEHLFVKTAHRVYRLADNGN